ncbi:MAG: hypothetical protein ACREBN_10960 [Burkholderiaceae bacterium]
MNHLLATTLAVILTVTALPGIAQDKKAEPTKDAPQAAATKDDNTKKSDAKATDAAKDTKEPKKKVRKGGC